MKYVYMLFATVAFAASLQSCGSTAEDISFGYDHVVPQSKVLTDSIVAKPTQTIDVKIEVTDNVGLQKLVLTYPDWGISQVVDLTDTPKNYLFEASVEVPSYAIKQWEETITEKDGTVRTIVQTYHPLVIVATDVNMNQSSTRISVKVE